MSEQEVEPTQNTEENVPVQKEPENVPIAEVEDAAKASGWNPDGEKTALEFLSDGREYRDRDRSEIRELKTQVQAGNRAVAEFITKQDTKTYATETEAWEAKFDEAVEAGDQEAVRQLRANLPDQPQPVQQPVDPDPTFFERWRTAETWFDESTDLQETFHGFYEAAHKQRTGKGLPRDDKQAVLDATVKMKKDMPHKFKQAEEPANPNESRGSGADTGTGQRKRSSKKGLSRRDLTEVEVKHFDQFVNMDMDPDGLLKSIQEQRDAAK